VPDGGAVRLACDPEVEATVFEVSGEVVGATSSSMRTALEAQR
tara:strand:+ start:836 stop:964 length:129 start_codon:yes stop_codon:yes gene_type:complete